MERSWREIIRHSTSVASRPREISRNGGAMIRVIRIVAGGRKKKKTSKSLVFPFFPPFRRKFRSIRTRRFRFQREGEENLQRLNSGRCV